MSAMIYFTGSGITPRTQAALVAHPLIGVLTQPRTLTKAKVAPFRIWAADNGCFSQGHVFSLEDYLRWLVKFSDISDKCAFATAPDVVGDADATWERSEPAFERIRDIGYKVALVAQNGFEDSDPDWEMFDALFLGGDTDWKLSNAARATVAEANARGKWTHMGRVNSMRRFQIAMDFGCDSVDGNFLMFGPDKNLAQLISWVDSAYYSPTLFGKKPRQTGREHEKHEFRCGCQLKPFYHKPTLECVPGKPADGKGAP